VKPQQIYSIIDNNMQIGFVGGLALVFIALKLCGVIGWSWWVVTSPIWVSVVVALFLVFVALGAIALSLLLKK